MGYSYKKLRPEIFKEDDIGKLLIMHETIIKASRGHIFTHYDLTRGVYGDDWFQFALIDYFVERGTIRVHDSSDIKTNVRYIK